jgi:hypothetical protein
LSSKTEKLAALLLEDAAKPKIASRHNIIPCFSCGYTFVYRGRIGGGAEGAAALPPWNGRFCSLRCQEWFDSGNPSFEQQQEFERKLLRAHHPIRCKGCHKEFWSKGLRCCSRDCEKAYLEREENRATLAEARMEAAPKKICAAPDCDVVIPKWKNGRKVSARVTFCSPKCRVKAHRAQTPPCNDKTL